MKRHYKILTVLLAVSVLFIPVILMSAGENDLVLNQNEKRLVESREAESLQSAYRKIADIALPSVVSIKAETVKEVQAPAHPFYDDEFLRKFFGFSMPEGHEGPRKRKGRSFGTGFIISEDGYLISNHHVIENAEKILITFKDRDKTYEAEVVGSDPDTDIALLKIKSKEKFPALVLGDSDELKIGDIAVAIGNPFGLQFTYTSGVISATGRNYLQGGPRYQNFIQTDVAINPGNSGGPLLNIYGQVIGINSMIFSRTGGNIGIGFAIPVNMAVNIVRQLKQNGKVVRGWLGVMISDVSDDQADALGIDKKGVFVPEVQADSPAEKAGVKAGDIIVSYNGRNVKDSAALARVVAATKPGTDVKLGVFRKGKEIELDVKIAAQKGETNRRDSSSKTADDLGLGLDLKEEVIGGEKKVVIVSVHDKSPFAGKNVRSGDIIEMLNWESVGSVSELKKLVKDVADKKMIFHIKRGSYLSLVVIAPLK